MAMDMSELLVVPDPMPSDAIERSGFTWRRLSTSALNIWGATS